MDKEELQMFGSEIVAYSGDAHSTLLELLKEARQENFKHIDSALKEADKNLTPAHDSQIKILAEKASGKEMGMGFIFIHGQSHLMTTLLLKDLIQDFIVLYRQSQR